MILCLDVGNSHIFGGVFDNDRVVLRFRHTTTPTSTSDQLGIFLRSVLRENNISENCLQEIAICSVVPATDYSLRSACLKYFEIDPFYLQVGVKTGLKITTRNSSEVGADLIADAIAATHHFPGKDILVVDFGTATTITAVSKNKEFLGGIFTAGVRTTMEALSHNAAKLSPVQIVKPKNCLGRSTAECIQSGLYYSQLGLIKESIAQLKTEVFSVSEPVVIATGGFAYLFESENLFAAIVPDLVLHGLRLALEMNMVSATGEHE